MKYSTLLGSERASKRRERNVARERGEQDGEREFTAQCERMSERTIALKWLIINVPGLRRFEFQLFEASRLEAMGTSTSNVIMSWLLLVGHGGYKVSNQICQFTAKKGIHSNH